MKYRLRRGVSHVEKNWLVATRIASDVSHGRFSYGIAVVKMVPSARMGVLPCTKECGYSPVSSAALSRVSWRLQALNRLNR